MSIEAMRQVLEVLEQINQLSIGDNAIALPGEIDAAMDNLRAAIEQGEKPMAWFHADNYKTRFTTDPSEEMVGKYWKPLYTVPRQEQPLKIDPADCHIRVGEVSEPISVGGKEPYDQTSPQREWAWMPAPIKTQWGHDMVVADLAIDKDHTVSIYCERDQIKSVEGMFAPQPQQAEKQEPVAWMYDFMSDNEAIRNWMTQDYADIARENGFNVRPLYAAPRQEYYDQTSLELCEECGWKAVIPGDGCLVCARQKAKPVWIPRTHLEAAQREPSMCRVEPTKRLPDFVPLYAAPRQWVGLTNKDIIEMWPETSTVGWDDIRLIEAKLKGKNT